jgi:hypothetical protein
MQGTQIFPLQAGSVTKSYWKVGKAFCYGFFTDITSFTTELIKYTGIPHYTRSHFTRRYNVI